MTTTHEDDTLAAHMQAIPASLLLRIALGEEDAVQIARELLADQGIGTDGKWVGFSKAAAAWQVD